MTVACQIREFLLKTLDWIALCIWIGPIHSYLYVLIVCSLSNTKTMFFYNVDFDTRFAIFVCSDMSNI